MSKKFVYICSPCRGDYEKNIAKARAYCRVIVTFYPDVIPIAPHLYFTQFLDDGKPNERSLGMEDGLALLDICDEIWVFGPDNPSEGMKAEIDYAHKNGIPLRSGDFVKKIAASDKIPELTEEELGDATFRFPAYSDDYGDMKIANATAVSVSGSTVVEVAKALRRNRGKDVKVSVEAENV